MLSQIHINVWFNLHWIPVDTIVINSSEVTPWDIITLKEADSVRGFEAITQVVDAMSQEFRAGWVQVHLPTVVCL